MHALLKMQALHQKRGCFGCCTFFGQSLHSQIPSVLSGVSFWIFRFCVARERNLKTRLGPVCSLLVASPPRSNGDCGFSEPSGAGPGLVASPHAATGASAQRLTMNQ